MPTRSQRTRHSFRKLDIGSGYGDPEANYIGMDPGYTKEGARAVDFDDELYNLNEGDLPRHRIVGVAEHLPFKTSSMNYVRSGQVFGEYSDLYSSLEEAIRVLKPKRSAWFRLSIEKEDIPELRSFLRTQPVRNVVITPDSNHPLDSEDPPDWYELRLKKV
jgi:ubiquinone/menaquinone biosynthesis C-methylase UbiE